MLVCQYCKREAVNKKALARHQKTDYCKLQQKEVTIPCKKLMVKSEAQPEQDEIAKYTQVIREHESTINKFTSQQEEFNARLKEKDSKIARYESVLRQDEEKITAQEIKLKKLEEYKAQLIEYDKQIAVYEAKLESSDKFTDHLVKVQTTKGGQRAPLKIQHLKPLTEEYIISSCEKYFTEEHTTTKDLGYAKFALECPFKDRLICTNKSGMTLRYKDENGEEQTNGIHMVNIFLDCIREKNKNILDPIMGDMVNMIGKLDGSAITAKADEVYAFGLQQHITKEFVVKVHKQICVLLSI